MNISRAIKAGNYVENTDGAFTVFEKCQTKDDGKVINFEHKVRILTISPKHKNGDILTLNSKRVQSQNIDEEGNCRLYPLDGQSLALPGSGVMYALHNIYELPS